jgi:large subunit ribosomal protein L24
MAAKIKKGDKVVVLTGRDKGKRAKSSQVHARRTTRRGARRQHGPPHPPEPISQGWHRRVQGAPIHLSNLALVDPKDGKPTRVGFKVRTTARRCAWPSVRGI